jgi:serine/threonine-protein kinase
LQKVADGQTGSITAFLFQGTRCKCQPKNQAPDNDMADRFWRLKEEGLGKTFSSDAAIIDIRRKTDEPTSIDLLPGAVIGGVYGIVRLIAKGGMGEVYLAQHLTLGKTCALKLIPPDQVTEVTWQRFQNEAKSVAGLEHVNLVRVTDLGIHEGCLPFYAMEYIDGQTLAGMLVSRGPLPLKMVLDIFIQICDGVDYAHRNGVIHRDLKPANIMLSKAQTGKLTVKILDFGLVKLTKKDRNQQSLTSVGEIFGSPFYMSPEQCIGGKIDNRSDIYSLGCTMFESLTGRPPFLGPSPVEIVSGHQTVDPPSLDSVVGAKVFPEALEVVLCWPRCSGKIP